MDRGFATGFFDVRSLVAALGVAVVGGADVAGWSDSTGATKGSVSVVTSGAADTVGTIFSFKPNKAIAVARAKSTRKVLVYRIVVPRRLAPAGNRFFLGIAPIDYMTTAFTIARAMPILFNQAPMNSA
ncbi:MAG: hypothetical protein RBT62_03025 [Spirochaetia bacterium]|nr:hypothetical protein [Spirochaetia bacterium]